MASVKAWTNGEVGEPLFPDEFEVVKKAVLQVTDIKTNRNKYYAIELHAAEEGGSVRYPGLHPLRPDRRPGDESGRGPEGVPVLRRAVGGGGLLRLDLPPEDLVGRRATRRSPWRRARSARSGPGAPAPGRSTPGRWSGWREAKAADGDGARGPGPRGEQAPHRRAGPGALPLRRGQGGPDQHRGREDHGARHRDAAGHPHARPDREGRGDPDRAVRALPGQEGEREAARRGDARGSRASSTPPSRTGSAARAPPSRARSSTRWRRSSRSSRRSSS